MDGSPMLSRTEELVNLTAPSNMQSTNIPSPMRVTVSGIATEVRAEHPAKAESPDVRSPAGRTRVARLGHCLKE